MALIISWSVISLHPFLEPSDDPTDLSAGHFVPCLNICFLEPFFLVFIRDFHNIQKSVDFSHLTRRSQHNGLAGLLNRLLPVALSELGKVELELTSIREPQQPALAHHSEPFWPTLVRPQAQVQLVLQFLVAVEGDAGLRALAVEQPPFLLLMAD